MSKITTQVKEITAKGKQHLLYCKSELNFYQKSQFYFNKHQLQNRKKIIETTEKYLKQIQSRKYLKRLKNQMNNGKNLSNCQKNPCTLLSQRKFQTYSQLNLKRSIFNPSRAFIQSILERISIFEYQVPMVPMISINHYNNRWLLLQAPYFSHDFFKKINEGILGNGYQQLIRIFTFFCKLTQMYGFFQPTSRMIFVDELNAYAWINEDIFSVERMIPLKEYEGQRLFVVAFLAMIEAELKDWQKVFNIISIDDTIKLLKWRAHVYSNSIKSEHFPHKIQSKFYKDCPSSETNELCFGKHHQTNDTSEQRMKPNHQFDKLQRSQSWNATILEKQLAELLASKNNNEMSKIRHKLSLNSTSSTIEQLCEKSRLTIEKIKRGHQQSQNQRNDQVNQLKIQNQFDGLFIERDPHFFEIGVEGEPELLQKITEEMQQILI